jgi:hypothetical protein
MKLVSHLCNALSWTDVLTDGDYRFRYNSFVVRCQNLVDLERSNIEISFGVEMMSDHTEGT